LKVFITDADFKHTLGAIRALAKEGVEVHAGSHVRTALGFYSKYTSRKFLYPDPTLAAQFLPAIERIDRQENYNAILPVGNETCFSLITGSSSTLRKKIPAPPLASYLIACNKAKTLALAKAHAIPIPKTIFPPDPESDVAKLHYPAIAKPALGSGNTRTLQNAEEAVAYWRALRYAGIEAVIQEFVRGEGYGFFALYSQGNMQAFFMHRRLREVPPSGGPSAAAQSVYEPRLLKLGRQVLDLLSWNGVAMVEFRRHTQTGEFELLEVNPKFWGSLDLALAGGVNFPYLAAQLAAYGACNPPTTYSAVKFCWPIMDDYEHLRKHPSSTFRVLSDWANPSVKKNVWLADLRPQLAFAGVMAYVGVQHAIMKLRSKLTPKPEAFSWVIRGKLAASSKPESIIQLLWLKRRGIDSILDLTEKASGLEAAITQHDGSYLNVPMADHAPPTPQQITRAVRFVAEEIQRGRPVLVHCLGGLGRAGTVLACYLAEAQGLSAERAISEIRKGRVGSIEKTQEVCIHDYAKSWHS
jgi:protein-tyrosine phosphatase/predicted ATP-grasp superfamily ATP-dependent carboligase